MQVPSSVGSNGTSTNLRFLSDGGEMGALIRDHDWSSTSLGPPTGWPQAIRTAVADFLARCVSLVSTNTPLPGHAAAAAPPPPPPADDVVLRRALTLDARMKAYAQVRNHRSMMLSV